MFTPPTPVLSLGSDLSPSLSSQPRPPRQVSRQASRAGECRSAPILCAGISPLCPPHPCCCALLRGSEAFPFRHPQSPPAKGLPIVWKPFLLHSSLPLVQVPSLFFCLCLLFLLFKKVATERWRKSNTRRSLSSPQIHQKYIYTWNNSYRTPTERWQKTSDLPKGKKVPTYLGRAKEKRINRDKRIRTGPAPVGGSCEGGKVSIH